MGCSAAHQVQVFMRVLASGLQALGHLLWICRDASWVLGKAPRAIGGSSDEAIHALVCHHRPERWAGKTTKHPPIFPIGSTLLALRKDEPASVHSQLIDCQHGVEMPNTVGSLLLHDPRLHPRDV